MFAERRRLEVKTKLGPWNPAIVRFGIHQNDIRTDSADAVPGDHIVILPAPKTEKPAGAGDNDGNDIPFGKLDPGISDIAQPPPVADTYDLFAVKIRKFRGHIQPSRSHVCSNICQRELEYNWQLKIDNVQLTI